MSEKHDPVTPAPFPEPSSQPPDEDPPTSGRLEAFSDGVFAVAITLLVLDLRAPDHRGAFLTGLLQQWPSYVDYLAAFLVIGVVWLTHHTLFHRIHYSSTRLALHNLLHLLLTSLVPFAAAVVSSAFRNGDRKDDIIGVVFLAIITASLSVSWLTLTRYVAHSPQLLRNPSDSSRLRKELRTQPLALIPPVIATAVAFANPLWGLIVFALSPVYYLATILHTEPRLPPRSATTEPTPKSS